MQRWLARREKLDTKNVAHDVRISTNHEAGRVIQHMISTPEEDQKAKEEVCTRFSWVWCASYRRDRLPIGSMQRHIAQVHAWQKLLQRSNADPAGQVGRPRKRRVVDALEAVVQIAKLVLPGESNVIQQSESGGSESSATKRTKSFDPLTKHERHKRLI